MSDKIKLIIEKFLKIKRCYGCGHIIFWQKGVLRYIEDPDNLGFVAPACSHCRRYAERHQYNNHK